MSRSFKKNSFMNDLFPMPRFFAKKNRTRKIRKGMMLSYADTKITEEREFILPSDFDNSYKAIMK